MEPSYIRDVLLGNDSKEPIVIISDDGQRPDIIEQLQQSHEFGYRIITTDMFMMDDNKQSKSTKSSKNMWNDMMVAVFATNFIGVRASTMSVNIGMFRYLNGEDPQSNKIYVYNPSNATLTVCAECIFTCSISSKPTVDPVCGNPNSFVSV